MWSRCRDDIIAHQQWRLLPIRSLQGYPPQHAPLSRSAADRGVGATDSGGTHGVTNEEEESTDVFVLQLASAPTEGGELRVNTEMLCAAGECTLPTVAHFLCSRRAMRQTRSLSSTDSYVTLATRDSLLTADHY